jgi:hypothetical protein
MIMSLKLNTKIKNNKNRKKNIPRITALIPISLNSTCTRAREELEIIGVLDDEHMATRGT